MKLPTDMFLKAIEEKKLYYFSSTQLNTDEPHHYVCIKKTDNDILLMTVCTSQYDTVKRFVETKKLPYETLVWITSNDTTNPFTKDTYVNCNKTFTFTMDEFKTMYEKDSVNYSGQIADVHYIQIVCGIIASPMIDDETKELLPDPDTI